MPHAASSDLSFADSVAPSPAPGDDARERGGERMTELDAVALQRLRDLDPSGGGRLVQRVLRAFDGSLQRLVPQLVAARASGDEAGIRHVAHTLKSSSTSVGALALAALCGEIEAVVRDQTGAPLPPLLDAFEAESRAVLRAVRPYLGSAE